MFVLEESNEGPMVLSNVVKVEEMKKACSSICRSSFGTTLFSQKKYKSKAILLKDNES